MTAALDLRPGRTAGAGCGSCTGCSCRDTGGPASGEYMVIGRDERWRVHHTTRFPFRLICNIEYDAWPRATGTLIGPRTVLTAGHVLHLPQGGTPVPRVPGRMRVVPGRNGPLEPLPATQAVRFWPHPAYARGTTTDIGVIHLANPIGNTVGWWGRNRYPAPGDPLGTSIGAIPRAAAGSLRVSLSGYPSDLPLNPALGCRTPGGGACAASQPGSPGRQRTRCGTEQWQSRNVLVSLAQRGLLLYRNDTCGGHSGSPVWLTRPRAGGGRVLVGVHVAASPDGRSNRAVRLTPAVLSWIRSTII